MGLCEGSKFVVVGEEGVPIISGLDPFVPHLDGLRQGERRGVGSEPTLLSSGRHRDCLAAGAWGFLLGPVQQVSKSVIGRAVTNMTGERTPGLHVTMGVWFRVTLITTFLGYGG